MNGLQKESIPEELRKRSQWLCWKRTAEGGKMPVQINGQAGKSNDPTTWSTFDEVCQAYEDNDQFAGIAYVISADDPFIGFDLDNCLDDHGDLREWAVPIVEQLSGIAYGEVSPSGGGVKFTMFGGKPEGARCVHSFGENKQQLECYDHARFWCMTGDVFRHNRTMDYGQEAVQEICRTYLMCAEPDPKSEKRSTRKRPNERNGAGPTTYTCQKRLRERARAYLAKCEAPGKGTRNQSIFNIAGHVLALDDGGYQLSVGNVTELMLEFNAGLPEPLGQEEVRDTVGSAARNGTRRQAKPRQESAVEKVVQRVAEPQKRQESGEWVGVTEYQTHNELAIRFINEFGGDMRFVRNWKCWIVWDGDRWRKDESGRDALQRARRFAHDMWSMVGDFAKTIPTREEMGKCTTFVKASNQIRNMEAFLKAASADRRILIDHDDLNPDPMLLNLPNGTLDLRTGELRKHCKQDLITMIADVEFDVAAACPAWRLVAISEPESGAKLRESRVKEMTGDAFITARGMRENPWTFARTFTFWMSTNHKPEIAGTDDGIWRRIKLIKFIVGIRRQTEPIPDYDNWLAENEGPGILNWLIGGYLDYLDNGFVEADCVTEAVKEYRIEEDHLGDFVAECCLTGQADYQVTAKELYAAYSEWAGKEAMSLTKFGKEMSQRYRKERPVSGEHRKQTMYYGIGLTVDRSRNTANHDGH